MGRRAELVLGKLVYGFASVTAAERRGELVVGEDAAGPSMAVVWAFQWERKWVERG